jgi:hypothetical protein
LPCGPAPGWVFAKRACKAIPTQGGGAASVRGMREAGRGSHEGWRALIGTALDDTPMGEQEGVRLYVFCPECAERESDLRRRARRNRRRKTVISAGAAALAAMRDSAVLQLPAGSQ